MKSDKRRRFFLTAAIVAAAIGVALVIRWLVKRLGQYNNQKGFTLLEMVLGVAIIALIGGAVLKAIDTNARAGRVLDEQVQATNLAMAYMEGMRQLSYDDSANAYSTVGAGVNIPAQYSISVNVAYSPDASNWYSNNNSGAYKLQKITISVSRSNGKLVQSTCTFRTKR